MQPTVVAMAFVCRAAAVVTKAGWALGVTKGRVTLAVTNMALARTEDVNAVQAGTESTAPLVGRELVSVLVALWVCISVSLGWVLWGQYKRAQAVCLRVWMCVKHWVKGRLGKERGSMLN